LPLSLVFYTEYFLRNMQKAQSVESIKILAEMTV